MPGQLRVELTYPDRKETRVLNQADSDVIFGDRPAAIATAAQRDAMRLQLMRLYSPLHLRDRRDSVSLTLDGEYCALSLQEGGLRSDYLVDGVLMHQKENKFAGNVNTAVLQLRQIELQARLENDVFLP